ncbi:hypothetical protein GCM10009759_71240 [Kitasatospora saccharophila]|uniref:Uncharacterized protein n=1 Tax=Kitasatospora saccharophila TaxID=407973 RepID=A0ABP5JR35_9ACTN
MFRLVPTRLWESTQRRLRHAEDILATQAAGWEAPMPPVDGNLADVLRHVDAAVRDEATCRAADYCERSFDEHDVLGLTMPERWTGYPDGTAVHYLGAGQWLHYHPGRTKLRTYQSLGWSEAEEIHLIKSSPRPWEMQTVDSLPALLELLDLSRPDPRSTDSGTAAPAAL